MKKLKIGQTGTPKKKRVSEKAENASQSIYNPLASGCPQTPGRNGSVLQADSPAHQEKVKKVNCFLKTGRIFIWNYSFRAQIRLRMHLRASRTFWGPCAAPRPQWQCTTGRQPCIPKKGKKW